MENTLIFTSEKEVRFGKLLKFIIPTYLTSLFNTVYTIIDGIFVSAYVGTDALASINIVYPIVNVLTGIALVFATGGSQYGCSHPAWVPYFPAGSCKPVCNPVPARCD